MLQEICQAKWDFSKMKFLGKFLAKKWFKSRRGPKARGGTSNKKTRKFFDLIRHYFFHSMLKKTFLFNQALFLEVGTRFSSENEGNQISLLSHPKGQYYSPQELLKYLLLKLIICGNIQSLSMIILRVCW